MIRSINSINIWLILLNIEISVCSTHLPCHFFDSINITNGIWHEQQQQVQNRSSIIFEGIEFRPNQYAEVDYTEDDGMRNVTAPHLRGCLCKIKRCHRLCCSHEQITINNDTVKSLEDKCNEELNQIENEVYDESSKFINLLLGYTIIKFDNKICLPFFVHEDYMNVMYSDEIRPHQKNSMPLIKLIHNFFSVFSS